jgi:DNA polymerase
LADARKALASIARGKLLAGLARVHADGRMRDTLVYYGAHTGRWSGRGMQLHNLPRPAAYFENLPADTAYPHTINAKGERVVDVDALAEEVIAGRPCDADAIALLVRATLFAPPGRALVAMDFASVEARGTAWMAGDSAALDVFRSGRDPYKTAAAAIFACDYDAVTKAQRQIGKIAELACGFGGGPAAFEKFAHAFRVDVSALDLDAIVGAWRTLHAPIRALWYTCERAFRSACNGRPACAGPLEFVPSDTGDAVACFLPSGRPIVYNDAHAGEDSLSYVGNRGREHTYGGKLVENAVQATCRDLLARAMLTVDAAALPIVLHVHDEIVVEVREDSADDAARILRDAMLDVPAWAAGFPIDASGWTGRRYRK